MCYTTNWSQYRSAPYTFSFTDHIEADLCTHIIHAFLKITGGKLDWYEYNDDGKFYLTVLLADTICIHIMLYVYIVY